MNLPKNHIVRFFSISFFTSFIAVFLILHTKFLIPQAYAAGWVWGQDPNDDTQFVVRSKDNPNDIKLRIDASGNLNANMAGGAADSGNLVPNGGFENVFSSSASAIPAGWNNLYFDTGCTTCTISNFGVDTSIFRGGSRSLKLITPSSGGTASISSDAFPVEPGKTYQTFADYYCSNTANVSAYVVYFSGDTTQTNFTQSSGTQSVFMNNVSCDNTWQNSNSSISVPSTNVCLSAAALPVPCTRARVVLKTGTTNITAYFDNVKITSSASTTVNASNVSSGSFGSSTGGGNYAFPAQLNAIGSLCINGDCKTAWSQVSSGGTVTGTGTQNYITKWNNAGGTAIGNSLVFDNGTNVGIGTTGPRTKFGINQSNTHTGTTGLTVANSGLDIFNDYQLDSAGKGAILTFSDYYNDGTWAPTTRAAIKGGTDTAGNTANGFLAFYTDSGGANSADERMRINSSGNVGIGTTGPAYKLDVSGGSDGKIQIIGTPSSSGVGFRADAGASGNVVYGMGGGVAVLDSSAQMRFSTNGSEKVRIDNSGNVGIGTTGPQTKLDVVGGTIQGNSGLTISAGTITLPDNSIASADVNFNYAGSASKGGAATTATALAANGTNCSAGYYPLGVDASGAVESCTAAGSGSVTGSGTQNYITKWNNAGGTAIGNSLVFDNGTNVGIGTTGPASGTILDANGVINAVTGYRIANAAASTNYLRGNGTNFVSSTIQVADVPTLNQSTTGSAGTLGYEDNRIISPSELAATKLKFGFTSYTNNNASPWADFLHLRSYVDSSGGLDNLLVFNKSTGLGMRLYQQTYESATAYATYKDIVLAENSPTTNYIPKYSGTGNTVSIVNSQIFDNGTNVGIGTTGPASKLDVVSGSLGYIGNTSVTDTNMEINTRGSSDRYAYIDFHGDDTYTDYGFRLIRLNTGLNAATQLYHRGTGNLDLFTNEAAPILLSTASLPRMIVTSAGNVGIGTTGPGALLDISSATNAQIKLSKTGANAGSATVYNDGNTHLESGTNGQSIWIGSNTSSNILLGTGGGNVGIGTTGPVSKLDVAGTLRISNSSTPANYANIYHSGAGGNLHIDSYTNSTYINYYDGNNLFVGNGASGYIATFEGSTGNVGIGTTGPGYKLAVVGSLYASGSSREYKENITDLAINSNKIYDLRPVTFDYKPQHTELGKYLGGGHQFGLIAEEVAKVIPELAVRKEKDGPVANVDYEKLSILLLDQLQKQKKTIENLENRIRNLEFSIKNQNE